MLARFAFLLLGAAHFAAAQDCAVSFSFTGSGSSPSFDNRARACTTWTIAYTSSGFATVSLAFQSAPDSSGAPGSWVAFAGTVNTGINPNTSTTQASSTFSGYYPWLRATVAVSGSGSIRGIFYGWRTGSARGGASGIPSGSRGTAWLVEAIGVLQTATLAMYTPTGAYITPVALQDSGTDTGTALGYWGFATYLY